MNQIKKEVVFHSANCCLCGRSTGEHDTLQGVDDILLKKGSPWKVGKPEKDEPVLYNCNACWTHPAMVSFKAYFESMRLSEFDNFLGQTMPERWKSFRDGWDAARRHDAT